MAQSHTTPGAPEQTLQRLERLVEELERRQANVRATEARMAHTALQMEELCAAHRSQLDALNVALERTMNPSVGALLQTQVGVAPEQALPPMHRLPHAPPDAVDVDAETSVDSNPLLGGPSDVAQQEAMRAFDALEPDFDYLHVISHDLREPVRGIAYFTQILAEEYAVRLDDEGREHLDYILSGTRRMARLLDDVLTLSRLRRVPLRRVDLDLQNLLTRAVQDLQVQRETTGAQIELHGQFPSVNGDADRLVQVFTQLLRNALMYSHTQPRVRIWADPPRGGMANIHVKDNGIGIEAGFHASIFKLFYRLHPWETYEGTGAGLAIVRLIVALHGGKVGVQSVPGGGSTFSVSLPATVR